MLRPDQVEWLRRDWFRLLGQFGVDAAAAEPALNFLVAAYSSGDRFYHNLEHIHETLDMARRFAGGASAPAEVDLAIWFHDVVYDTRSKDSEERSAEFAAATLAPLGLPSASIARICKQIQATAHLSNSAAPAHGETALILDADLAVLGAPEDRYYREATDIRREYAWVADGDYCNGRAKVLEAFLARRRIYWSELLHRERDTQARQNLTNELASLLPPDG